MNHGIHKIDLMKWKKIHSNCCKTGFISILNRLNRYKILSINITTSSVCKNQSAYGTGLIRQVNEWLFVYMTEWPTHVFISQFIYAYLNMGIIVISSEIERKKAEPVRGGDAVRYIANYVIICVSNKNISSRDLESSFRISKSVHFFC